MEAIAIRLEAIASRMEAISNKKLVRKGIATSSKGATRGAPGLTRNKDATRNKCIASSNKCLTTRNRKLLATRFATRGSWHSLLVADRIRRPKCSRSRSSRGGLGKTDIPRGRVSVKKLAGTDYPGRLSCSSDYLLIRS